MKIKTSTNNLIFFVTLIITVAAGVYIGIVTIYRYEIMVKGILGITTLYLIQLLFVPPKNFVSKLNGIQVEFPRDIKYIVLGFFLSVIMYWSGQSFLDTLVYYLKFYFINN